MEERIKVLEKESVPIREHSRALKSLQTNLSTHPYYPQNNSSVESVEEHFGTNNSEHILKTNQGSGSSPRSNMNNQIGFNVYTEGNNLDQ